jgi:hypothetical protein
MMPLLLLLCKQARMPAMRRDRCPCRCHRHCHVSERGMADNAEAPVSAPLLLPPLLCEQARDGQQCQGTIIHAAAIVAFA